MARLKQLQQPLRAGDRFRFEPSGPLFEIVRTTACAAYYRPIPKPVHVVIHNPDGTTREFDGHESAPPIAISLYSFVHKES